MSTVRLFPTEPERPAFRLPIAWGVGLALLAESLGSSIVLVLQHLQGLELPGCGPQSACALLASGAFGSLGPFPLSVVGVAWFAGMLVGWALSLRGLPDVLRWAMRLGALASLFYMGVMVWQGHLCPYCLAVHVANLLAWVCAERLPAPALEAGSGWPTTAAAGGMFALVLGLLWGYERNQEHLLAARSEEQVSQSIDDIASQAKTDKQALQAAATTAEPAPPSSTEPGAPAAQAPPVDEQPAALAPGSPVVAAPGVDDLPPSGFTGRYRRGPESARVRIVVWADYECDDCQTTEKLLAEVVRGRDDVSLSLRHFPFCEDCNPKATYNRHPQACRMARAVEAAGVLGGDKAYWAMSDWMLEHGKGADDAQYVEQAAKLGLDREQFRQACAGTEVGGRIAADIDEAMRYGLDRTPFVFVNGVELRGWRNPQQIEQAVLALAAKNLPAKTAEADQPRLGVEKYLQAWRNQQPTQIPAASEGWPLGGRAGDGPRIVFFGEHQSPQCKLVSDALIAALKEYPQTRLEFRHYPLSKRGNPLRAEIKVDAYPQSFDMALLAQAAGRVGGRSGFWKMHRWLLEHQSSLTPQSAQEAAAELKLDPDKLSAELQSPKTAEAIRADLEVAAQLGVRQAPMVAINGRPVDGLISNPEIIKRILDELAAEK